MSPVAKIRALDSEIARLSQSREELKQEMQSTCAHAPVNLIQACRYDGRGRIGFLPAYRVCKRCGYAEQESSEVVGRFEKLVAHFIGTVPRPEAEEHVIGGLHFAT